MVLEQDVESGRVTLHVRGCKLQLTKAEADKLFRFLFVVTHREEDAQRPVVWGYDRRGQAQLF